MDILGEYPVKTARIRGNVTGKHDLYILFRGGDEQLFDFDWWQMDNETNN